MFEKVNPSHPDKLADRIAGALVDYAYAKEHDPRIAVEVLLGHGKCHIIAETSVHIPTDVVVAAVYRIAGWHEVDYVEVPQDAHLSENQADGIRCGDNGIFKGMPVTEEQKTLSHIAHIIYDECESDGTRRKILLKLQEGKISSGDLAIALDMTPQALSYHLSKLKKADLIYETRYKNFIYYELNLSILDETIMWISNLRGGQQ